MTDQELNRAVAEARGQKEQVPMLAYGLTYYPDGISLSGLPLPDVCTDPAAWGALFEEIAASDCDVVLESDWHPDKKWTEWIACVWRAKVKYVESDLKPGRAIAKAFLASKGISVE